MASTPLNNPPINTPPTHPPIHQGPIAGLITLGALIVVLAPPLVATSDAEE